MTTAKTPHPALLPPPSPAEIVAARAAMGLSQAAAGAVIDVAAQTWARYESARALPNFRVMSAERWTLWMLLTGQHPTAQIFFKNVVPGG